MEKYISIESIRNSIEYFRDKHYSKPEQIGLFLYFKAAGLNAFGYSTYKKWGEYDSDEKEQLLRKLYDLSAIFDAQKETGQKYTALFPFSISQEYKPNSFYNGGSVFKSLCSRVSDTLDNTLVSTIIRRDAIEKSHLMFEEDYLDTIRNSQLKGQMIPLSKIVAWCYRFWKISIPADISERDVTDALILSFLLSYHISSQEFQSLFSYDTGLVEVSDNMISGTELRNLLQVRNDECKPVVIEDGKCVDYLPVFMGLSESRILELLNLRGEALSKERIIEILSAEDQRLIDKYDWESKSDIEKAIIECWRSKDFDYIEVAPLYAEFQEKFGKQAISQLSESETLYRLFGMMDDDSLVYNLEHSTKYRYFGKVGGYRTIYTLYQKDGEWKYGTNARKITTITEEEAIRISVEYRANFLAAFEAIDALEKTGKLETIDGFSELQKALKEKLGPVLYNRNWVWKYLHMLYPQYFINVYSSEWVHKVFRVAKIVPENNYTLQCGQFSLFARKLKIENVYLYRILEKLDDSEEINEDTPSAEDDTEEPVEDNVNRNDYSLPILQPRQSKLHPLNFILYGAPGTGKTYSTVEYALAIVENRNVQLDQKSNDERKIAMEKYQKLIQNGQVTFTTFHQSYGYEDFIQGLRPTTIDGQLAFIPVDGVFKKIAQNAMQHPESNYVIIIDEINRANISKVFGELITLIEEDKRWGEINRLSVTLPSGEVFAIPNNLYIIGTMNSADKSISLIDAALRRRFSFIEVIPQKDLVADSILRTVLDRLNTGLVNDLESTDLLIGHAYFMGKTANDLCDIMNNSIIPLLYEYFYDNSKKVENQVKRALEGLDYEIVGAMVGRLRIRAKD